MDKNVLKKIHRFWFGPTPADPEIIDPVRARYWMMGGEATDSEIRAAFGHLFPECRAWTFELCDLSREEAVALVVLYDQFPRNLYRTSGDAFAYDEVARDISRRLTVGGWDGFNAAERFFLGLPFVHHENMADQDHAVALAEAELDRAPAAMRGSAEMGLSQAIKHRAVIARFGRFPHRNVILGRESTPDELAFLATAERGRGF